MTVQIRELLESAISDEFVAMDNLVKRAQVDIVCLGIPLDEVIDELTAARPQMPEPLVTELVINGSRAWKIELEKRRINGKDI